ncbi:hypothetical protein HanXRQr2_Chr15g0717431 [Helianthus annuus]|uniref:Uncharacterized protein n=1 Tax=Helianthus annuus TaxID=4232 RepID=A0A9K3E429_HELAN|nr:hypothetical protein HanXRQr2_Chr15g0717431 [Helianthus annuus]
MKWSMSQYCSGLPYVKSYLLLLTEAILELVDLVRDSNSGNKYQDSVPSFEGFIYYTAALR